jgi:hypothetical protein
MIKSAHIYPKVVDASSMPVSTNSRLMHIKRTASNLKPYQNFSCGGFGVFAFGQHKTQLLRVYIALIKNYVVVTMQV